MPTHDLPEPDLEDESLYTPEFAALRRRRSAQTLIFGYALGAAGLAMGLYARAHGGTYVDRHHVTLPWWWMAGAGVFILALAVLGSWQHLSRRGRRRDR